MEDIWEKRRTFSFRPVSRHASLILVCLYLGTFLFLATSLYGRAGFPLDDSYIHQTVARNLAHSGVPGFYPGQRSSGATSLFWAYLQAADYTFFGGAHPVLYNLVISAVLLSCIGPLLFRLAQQDGLSPLGCWTLAATPALCGNFMWLGLIGMEHLLFVVLSLLAIYFWLDPSPQPGRRVVLTGLACGLLAATRPEAIVFAPLLLLVSRSRERSRRDTLTVLGIWSCFLVLVFGYNLYTSHSMMPATLKGRTWLYFHTSGGPHSPQSMMRYLGAWTERLPRLFSPDYTDQISSLGGVHGAFAVLSLLLVALVLSGAVLLLRQRPLRVGVLLAWAAVHFSIYLMSFPSGGHGGRYQPLSLLLVFPLLSFAVLGVLSKLARSRAHWPGVAYAAIALVAGVASLSTWRVVTIDGLNHISGTHGQMATWMRDNLPPNASVAAFDIGRISYKWDGKLIDLGGLVDPSYVPYLTSGHVGDYLEKKGVQYVILPDKGVEGFGWNAPGLQMTELVHFCTPRQPWLVGFRYTINAMRCQDLYELHYPSPANRSLAELKPAPAVPAPAR